MSAIDQLFARLRSERKKAFMPFITAGDPHLQFTEAVIRELAGRGCHMVEVGIPYSDPIADGPVIQASYTRALGRGVTLPQIIKQLDGLGQDLDIPLVTMVSYAIVMRRGMEQYVAEAREAGIAGAIVPDLLVEEAAPLAAICKKHDFSLIQLVTPTTPRDRARRIAEASSGFLYYVSVTGITGERTELPPELQENVGWIREQTDLPVCIGFGIATPDHVRLLAPVADGLIVGSAIVRRFATLSEGGEAQMLREIGELATELMAPLP